MTSIARATLRIMLLGLVLVAGAVTGRAGQIQPQTFSHPPGAFAPRGWWHWLDGNISRDGITRDLEALHDAGIVHVTLFDLGLRLPTGPVKEVLSEEWFAMVRFAADEAGRLGMKLGLTIHPGFSGAGGPWIMPEMSMKRLVWSDTVVDGGRLVELALPPLPSGNLWSRDTAVIAWPVRGRFAAAQPEMIALNGASVPKAMLADGNPFTRIPCPRTSTSWRLSFSYGKPLTAEKARLLFVATDNVRFRNSRPLRLQLRAGDNVVSETELSGEALRAPIDLSFAPTTSVRFEIEITAQDGPFNFTGQLFLAEAELLTGAERARWSGTILDWDRQIGDGDGTPTEGGRFADGAAQQAIEPGEVRELTSFVQDGRLRWECPPGTWRVVRFGYASIGKMVRPTRAGAQGLESDKMSTAATDLAFQGYALRTLTALTPQQRAVFDLLLIDSWECGKQNWTDDFPAAFAEKRRYPLTRYWPALAGEIVSSPHDTARFLNDFRETIADLVTERFYARARELANRAGLRLEAQIGDGQGFDPDWDVFAMARAVDLPMDEFWTEPDTERFPRGWQVADAAYLAGGKTFTSEAFTGRRADWRNTPGDFDRWAQIALQRGVGQFALHSTVHQPGGKPPGLTLGGNGEHFTPTNTWWPFVSDWMESLRRSHYLVQTSEPVGELLVYNGDTMPRPPPQWAASFAAPHRLFVDRPALLSRVTTQNGLLQLDGKGAFRALVLPRSESIKVDALEKMAALVRDGATLIGLPPAFATGLDGDDARIRELSATLWSDTQIQKTVGRGKVIKTGNPGEAMNLIGFAGDVASESRSSEQHPLEYSHRRAGDADVYFLLNPNAGATEFTCRVSDGAHRLPELWWPRNGRTETLSRYSHEAHQAVFSLSLEGHQGVFLVLRQAVTHEGGGGASPPAAKQIPMAFTAPWRVTFGPLGGSKSITLPELMSWTSFTEPLLRDYSGTAVYENTFTIGAEATAPLTARLDLGDVGNVARVSVNNAIVGTRWRAPWTFDIGAQLRLGTNSIRIEVANLWQNRILADLKLPVAERVTSTSAQAENFIRASSPLPSGLLGPVTLMRSP